MWDESYFEQRRESLVQWIEERGIRDRRVLEAFRRVPRHRMVPSEYQFYAYDDNALPIGEGQTISQPSLVAHMTELLTLKGHERVLEIGTGSGYQAAVLSLLCQQVVTIERNPLLTLRTFTLLTELEYLNLIYVIGDGTKGFPPLAPYDGIIVTAGAPQIPPPLLEQLSSEGGRLVIPLGPRHQQMLTLLTKRGEHLLTRSYGECVFVPLVGEYGHREDARKGEWENSQRMKAEG